MLKNGSQINKQNKSRIQISLAFNYDRNIGLYQFILILILTSMRNLTKRQSSEMDDSHVNYKELYLQCKKNVAVFMKHVDTQMSDILSKHEQEKKKLENEIERLMNELKYQNSNLSSYNTKNTSMRPSHKRSNSQSYVNTQDSITSVSRQAVEQCLSRFHNLDHLSGQTTARKSQHESRIQTTIMKSIIQDEKENHTPAINLNEDFQLKQMKGTFNSCRRDKRLKEKKAPQNNDKAQDIKDFLKDIRGRLSSREKCSALKEKDHPLINVITPELFTAHKMRNH